MGNSIGAVGGLLGIGGGQSGTGIDAPSQAPIQQGAQAPQLDQAYGQSQEALLQQTKLMQALAGANGIGNQSSVFNQQQAIASGQGPNPAQAMLNQSTGQNVANQAALMAGQRGSNANTGLMARQIAQQGANIQQQSAGQGATLQANQSLNALNQMGNIANTQVANQMAATGANTGAQQTQYGNVANALSGQNQANVSSQSSVNAANAGMANTQLQGQQALVGGMLNNIGGAMFGGSKAYGGVVGMANGGMTGPQSSFGQFMTTVQAPGSYPVESPSFTSMASNPGAAAITEGVDNLNPKNHVPGAGKKTKGFGPTAPGSETGLGSMGPSSLPPMASRGGLVDVVVSPGEKIVPPHKVQQAAGGRVEASRVPGRPVVSGDSTKNDTVPMKLPAGSVVIPRTKAGDDKDTAAFVRAVLAKRGRK